ncbi:MAG TPA: DMT family transporter [Bacillales bacterium]|nr:DMT family transporter [Bacillales bacterium]
MEKNSLPVHPYWALLIGVCAVSTSAIFVKLSSAPASVIATYRLAFTVLLMTPLIVSKYRPELLRISGKDWLICTAAGVFLAFHFIFWFGSLDYTSVASSVVLVALQPIFAFIGTYIFFHERFTAKTIAGGLLAVAGSVIISWGDFQGSGAALWGDIMAVLGAIWVTVYFLFGQNARKRLSLMTYTYLVYGISSVTLFLYDFALGYDVTGYPAKDWWIFLGLALIPTLLGHTIFNGIIKWVSTSVVSTSILGEPIGASILAYFVLGEEIQLSQWIGGSVILLGIYVFLRSYQGTKRKTKKGLKSA